MFCLQVRRTTTIALALAAVMTVLASTTILAQNSAIDTRTSDILAQSDDLGSKGQWVDAVQMLIDAKSQANVDASQIDNRIERFVSTGLPTSMPPDMFATLPVDVGHVASERGVDLGLTAVVKPFVPSTAAEPQHGTSYQRLCYVYRAGPQGLMPLFCRVHYAGDDDADLALRIGRLLLYGRHILRARTERDPFNVDTEPIDVWLCRTGPSGGEQWRNNIYFYDLDIDRSSVEWIREVLHEYGHLAVPPVGGFTAPEYWANGYLGERLLVRWIQRTPGGPEVVSKIWGDFSGAQNFDRILIDPPIALYKKIGKNAHWEGRTDELGMRYFIGQVLTFDDTFGSAALGKAFGRLPRFHETRPVDVAEAMDEVAHPPTATALDNARYPHRTSR
jgi:hypothetical protein